MSSLEIRGIGASVQELPAFPRTPESSPWIVKLEQTTALGRSQAAAWTVALGLYSGTTAGSSGAVH